MGIEGTGRVERVKNDKEGNRGKRRGKDIWKQSEIVF